MKWLLPWHRFTIASASPPSRLGELLKAHVRDDSFYIGPITHAFVGEVEAGAFRVSRPPYGRYRIRAKASGTMESHGAGSRVPVQVHQPLGYVIGPTLAALVLGVRAGWVTGLVVGAVTYAISLVVFHLEADKLESMLRRVFAGRAP